MPCFFLFFSLKAASYPAAAVHGVLNLYSCLCRVSLKLPFSQMIFGRPKLWSILLYYVILSAGAVWLLQKKQKKVCYLVFVFMAIFFFEADGAEGVFCDLSGCRTGGWHCAKG